MKRFTIILLMLTLMMGQYAIAQVGINTDGSSPNSSAILDLKATDKGLLLPRMTTNQIQDISNPVAGLVVFNIDSANVYFYSGAQWVSMGGTSDTLWQCGSDIIYHGQSYSTVQIGTQCWTARNMNYSTGNSWCYEGSSSYCTFYGRLYDWATAMTVCPTGWHLPTESEWCTLTTYIDSTVNCTTFGYSGTDAGTKMKSTTGWSGGGNGTNISGFDARPGGVRNGSGTFSNRTYFSFFWTSTEGYESSYYRSHSYNFAGVARGGTPQNEGLSVRCIKD